MTMIVPPQDTVRIGVTATCARCKTRFDVQVPVPARAAEAIVTRCAADALALAHLGPAVCPACIRGNPDR